MKITIAFALMLVSSVTGRNVRRSRRNKSKSEQKNRELQTDPTNPLACTCIITCIEVDPEPKEPSECLVSEEICTFADGTSCSPSGEGFTGPTSDFCTDVPSANGRISLATFPADSQVVASEVTYSMTVSSVPLPVQLCVVADFDGITSHSISDGTQTLTLPVPNNGAPQLCYSDDNFEFTEFLAGLVNCPQNGYTVTLVGSNGQEDTRPVQSADGGPATTVQQEQTVETTTTTATTTTTTTTQASSCDASNPASSLTATAGGVTVTFLSGAGITGFENTMVVAFSVAPVNVFLFAITDGSNSNNVVFDQFSPAQVIAAELIPKIFECPGQYNVFLYFADTTVAGAPIG